jgi:hypothetical protein
MHNQKALINLINPNENYLNLQTKSQIDINQFSGKYLQDPNKPSKHYQRKSNIPSEQNKFFKNYFQEFVLIWLMVVLQITMWTELFNQTTRLDYVPTMLMTIAVRVIKR